MKSLLVLIVGAVAIATPSRGHRTLSCKSIDVTHVPYYTVIVRNAYPGRKEFTLYVSVRTKISGGEKGEEVEATGTLTNAKINLRLEDGTRLVGKAMSNGSWKAELKGTADSEELSCKVMIH